MKLDNNNLFDTLSQLRAGQYSAMYSAAAKTSSASIAGGAERPVEPGTDQASDGKTLTFDAMSRQQFSDWLSKGLETGKIPSEQEQAFRVLLYSGKAQSSGDQDQTDTSAVDFIGKAKEAVQSAAQRNDIASVRFWANAIATMNQFQGEVLKGR